MGRLYRIPVNLVSSIFRYARPHPDLCLLCPALPGICVSKITFHAHPYQTGLQPVLQWKVQTFPRTVHTAPHHTTFCGLQPWKVIFVSHFPEFLISHIRNPIALPRTFCSTSDTSGRKTPSQTLLSPYVSHLETADLPHSPLQATFPFFRCVISGANTALHTVFPPEVSHQENPRRSHTALYGTFLISPSDTSGVKTPFHAVFPPHLLYRE